MIGGRRLQASPAKAPHAIQHGRLDYVIGASVAPGYQTASDLLTRHDEESDFASDTSILKEGEDPQTGTRHLEEVAFEVVSEQNEKEVTEKARRMTRRGVRRVFAIFLKKERVAEWSASEGKWKKLGPDSPIEDRCFVQPLEPSALLDAAAAEDAVAHALIAKNNPVIAQRSARLKAESILSVLEARGLEVDEELRQRILACTDLDVLDRWLKKAAVVASAGEVVAGA
jgi:hypothetical protein